MSLRRPISAESTCSVLACTPDEFLDFYENYLETDILCKDVIENVINRNQQYLRAADQRLPLDDLLISMLRYAPHPDGKRYVAVALHIAQNKGDNVVVDVAKAWLDNLFLPILAIYRAISAFPSHSGSVTPTLDTAALEHASREFREKLANREQNYCALTHSFDREYVEAQGRGYMCPDAPQHPMAAAHIIPVLSNDFPSTPNICSKIKNAAVTWEMFKSWTQLDSNTIVGSDINSPGNGIFMTCTEYQSFGEFRFYFDKDVFPHSPNKYRVQSSQDYFRLSNGCQSVDVEFPTLEQSGVEPPNSKLLAIHASLAKVYHHSGAYEYICDVEMDIDDEGLDINEDISLLISKLINLEN